MKNFKKIILLGAMGTVIWASCKKFDKMLSDPSTPAPETADVDFYLNDAQLSFANFYDNQSTTPGINEFGNELMRMENAPSQTYKDLLVLLHLMVPGDQLTRVFLKARIHSSL